MNLDRIKDKDRLTFERAAAVWRADPEAGVIHWRPGSGKTGSFGARGKRACRCSYIRVEFEGTTFAAHRVMWLLCTGQWPKFVVDHINGDRMDNRLSNLRDVPHQVNQLNQKHHRSGLKKADYRRAFAIQGAA